MLKKPIVTEVLANGGFPNRFLSPLHSILSNRHKDDCRTPLTTRKRDTKDVLTEIASEGLSSTRNLSWQIILQNQAEITSIDRTKQSATIPLC
jgi:hypothetical protein